MFYNARYYNTATGIFLQADSVDDGLNKYQYVAGNPVNNTDPSGNECKWGKNGKTGTVCENPYHYGQDDQLDRIRDRFIGHNQTEITLQDLTSINQALQYFPLYMTQNITFQFVSNGKTNDIASVDSLSNNMINLFEKTASKEYSSFRDLSVKRRTEFLVHEMFHIWTSRNLNDFEDNDGNSFHYSNFNKYISSVR